MSLAYVYARGRCILFILLYFVHFFPKKYVLSGISSEEIRSKWDFFRRNKLTFVYNNTFCYKNHLPDAKKMVQLRHIGSIVNDVKNTKVRHIGSIFKILVVELVTNKKGIILTNNPLLTKTNQFN